MLTLRFDRRSDSLRAIGKNDAGGLFFGIFRSFFPSALRNRRACRRAISLELLEDRLVLDGAPDITLLSATTHGAQTLTISYKVENQVEHPVTFRVSVYRSDDAVYDGLDAPEDQLIDTANIQTNIHPGVNSELATLGLNTPLTIDPSRPYVVVVASPVASSSPYSETSFRIYTLGAVTHGFEYRQ